jgi:hypothetical protein
MRCFTALPCLILLGACAQIGAPKELFTGSLERERAPAPSELLPIAGVPGVRGDAVEACRDSIAAAANSQGAIQVEAVSAGTPTGPSNGITEAPIDARITYEQAGEVQVRRARITCQLSDEGRVVALL